MHLKLGLVCGLAVFFFCGWASGSFGGGSGPSSHILSVLTHTWFLDQVMSTVLARDIILSCSLTNDEQQGGRSPGRASLLW